MVAAAVENRFDYFSRITAGDTTAAAVLDLAERLPGRETLTVEEGSALTVA